MATGIEMLGQMGTDQSLAGPVQGGNMVVKPNQVPVGGAAMLAKALRGQADKGVGGMYVLPEQQDQTPEFMKIAQSNVMRDIEGQRNQFPGNFSESEGGIIPMLPRNLKTAPGADETTLAYITPEEQAILGLLNPGTPHRGPSDIPTYDSVDYDPDSGQFSVTSGAQASAQEAQDRGERQYGRQERDVETINQDAYTGGGLGEGQAYVFDDKGEATGDVWQGTPGTTTGEIIEDVFETKQTSDDSNKEIIEKKKTEIEDAVKTGDQSIIDAAYNDFFKMGSDIKNAIFGGLSKAAKSVWSGFFDRDKDDKKKDGKEKKAWRIPSLLGIGADVLGQMQLTPEKLRDENYLAIMQDVLKGDRLKEFEKEHADIIADAWGPRGGTEGFRAALAGAEAPKGSEAERRKNPEAYWKDRSAETMGDLEQLAEVGLTGDKYFDRRITEAREAVSKQRDAQDRIQGGRPRGMGGGTAPIVEDDITEAVVEEGATTMPYTGPRTGGAEVNVPLSRRFTLDPTQEVAQYRTEPRSVEDIYKYYTEGTEGEGLSLEPYSEFQKRRREALGKQPLDFWSY